MKMAPRIPAAMPPGLRPRMPGLEGTVSIATPPPLMSLNTQPAGVSLMKCLHLHIFLFRTFSLSLMYHHYVRHMFMWCIFIVAKILLIFDINENYV